MVITLSELLAFCPAGPSARRKLTQSGASLVVDFWFGALHAGRYYSPKLQGPVKSLMKEP